MKYLSPLIAILVLGFSSQLYAQSPVEFWGCKFNEGHNLSDLMQWTEEWNKVIDDLPDDGYNAWVMTPMFSSMMTNVDFLWVGAWPDYAKMGSGLNDFFFSESGSESFARFEEISTCEIHTLFTSTQVRANP